MVSAIDQVTAKLGEKRIVQQAETITGSSLQQLDTKAFAIEALRREWLLNSCAEYLKCESVIRMVEALRHHNPNCLKTTAFYINTVKLACRVLKKTPDKLAKEAGTMDEPELQGLLLKLDKAWIGDLNSPHTRVQKWAMIRKFFYANGIFKAKTVQPNMAIYNEVNDQAMTCDDCRHILDSCRTTADKLVVSLLIESLQRVGTITQLVWGDVLAHIEAGEPVFLVWVDAKRTKRNISHWMPVGKMSSYYMGKLLSEYKRRGKEVSESTQLVTRGRPRNVHAVERHVAELILGAGVRGRKQGQGNSTRYEKHVHSFRKFGVVEMQKQGVNQEIVRYLMGQTCSPYSSWKNRYQELLDIYRAAMPTLNPKDTVTEVVDFAKSRGLDLDPSALHKCRDIRADQGHSGGSQTEPGQEQLSNRLY